MENLRTGKLRVAVVGLGKMGLLHASILNVLHNVELKALCDKSALILRFSKKVFAGAGVDITSDLEKLSDLDLDLVYVTTPIFSHSVIAKNVYSSGIARNLFVEKTLASSYDEAKELCELAHRFGGINMVGYMKRFAVVFRKAKDLLAQEILGDVFSFEAYAYSSDFLARAGSSKASASRGGALRDLGCHVVDLALWFFGDLQLGSVKLHSITEREFGNSIDFSIKTSSGLEGQFRVSQCMENYRLPEVGFRISGSKGTMKVNDDRLDLKLYDGKSFLWYRHDLDDNVDFWLGEPEYFREDQYFVNSVLEGQSAQPSFHDASKVDQIIDQVRHEGGNN
jgi:predicted dehydrogenase